MKLDIQSLLSEETIYKHLSEHEIFEYYLGVTITDKLFRSPLRLDANPTCKFFYKEGRLYLKDFAWKTFSPISCVMQKETLSYREALLRIYNDLIKPANTPKPTLKTSTHTLRELQSKKTGTKFTVTTRPFTAEELAFWCIGGMKITEEHLNFYGIYAVDKIHEEEYTLSNQSFAFAYFENGEVNQIYFPKNKALGKRRFRSLSGFTFGGVEWLDRSVNYVVITKSKKDWVFLKFFGVNAAYVIHEKMLLDPVSFFKITRGFKFVFTLFDQDYTGRRLSVSYLWRYKTIPLLFSCEGTIKDFSECVEETGEEHVKELVQQVKCKLKL
jgi:hypothetical protein